MMSKAVSGGASTHKSPSTVRRIERTVNDRSLCGIPVTIILDSLAEGATGDEVLASYPSLRVDHIKAALAYAAELAHEERLVPIRAI